MTEKVVTVAINPHMKALVESLKEIARLYLVSLVPILGGILLMGINVQTGSIDINWMVLRAIFFAETITFTLRGIDRYKHVYLKSSEPEKYEGKSAGLLGF